MVVWELWQQSFKNSPLVKCNSKLTNLNQQFIVGGMEEVQMYIVKTLGNVVMVTLEIKTMGRSHGHFFYGTTSDNHVQLWWYNDTPNHATNKNEYNNLVAKT